jgi:capsular exopolysaccharide synthesis family protein
MPLSFSDSSTSGAIHLELYRAIRAVVETERLKAPFHSILVTSPGPGEGKSTTVLNLSAVFQEFGRRVLVVEGDLRSPTLHRTLGIANKPGLADFLRGTATFDQICRSLASGVTLIPTQVVREDIGTVLSPARVRELLELSRKRFDLVLFDSTPLLAVPDNLLLLTAFDRVMLVARAGQTTARELRQAQRILERGDARILGVVLNQANRHDVQYYHPRYARYYPGERAHLEASRPTSVREAR